jgi:cytochrome P450
MHMFSAPSAGSQSEINKEERAVLERNFLAFGNGPRTCLGKNISLMEMSKVVPQIVRMYDLDIMPDEQGRKYMGKTRWFAKPEFKAVIRRRVQTIGIDRPLYQGAE